MADDDEEIMEMEMDDNDEEEASKPQRRSPRRTRSTDGGAAGTAPRRTRSRDDDGMPSKRLPARSKSSDGSVPLTRRTPMRTKSDDGAGGLRGMRRNRAESTDATKDVEVDMEDVRPRRATPKRTKSSDGLAARMLPRRTRTTDGSAPPAPKTPGRTASGYGTPARSASGYGRSTPRRTKSSDGTTGGLLGMRRGRKKEKAGMSANSMNIFGSDMVSTDTIVADIEKARDNLEVTNLELEDFFIAERDSPEDIPLALKELLEIDDRPWESVVFVDDIMDGSMYSEYRQRKKEFLKNLGGVAQTRLIPVTYKTKVTLSSGILSMEEMVELLRKFQSDKFITSLTIKSDEVDESIMKALTALFSADRRRWESVTLQLSGGGPEQPGTSEHTAWCVRMQMATEEMQRVCKDRGINLG